MAVQALTPFNRLMHHDALADFIGRLCMTGIAKVLHLFLKQTTEPGDMGVMTGEAISISCRLMFHPFLKNIALMA